MARTALTVQTTSRTGLTPSFTAAVADGHAFDNSSGKVILHVKNNGAGSTTVTISTPATVDGLSVADLQVTVPAGQERIIGPFPKNLYNTDDSAVSGVEEAVLVSTSVQTGVSYAAIKLGSSTYS